MDLKSNNNENFLSYIFSYLTISVIAGLVTFRVINALLDYIVLPILDITVLPNYKFEKLTISFDKNKQNIKNKSQNYINNIRIGLFLKELIIWLLSMIILYFIYKL
tara:strand:- start:150 stop:467 length:318 start_codon:yes stop_codon:yes gene_type:complete